MTDRDGLSRREAEPSLGDLVEGAVRKIVTGIVIAGGLIGIGLYSQAGPARYQMVAADGHVYRLNTKSGVIVACTGDRCGFVLKDSGDIHRSVEPPTPPRPAEAPAPSAAPAPALPPAGPSAPPAPAPAPAPVPAAR